MVLAKGLLLLIFVAVCLGQLFPVIRENDDAVTVAVKKVHQTWDPKKDVKINEDFFVNDGTFEQSPSIGTGVASLAAVSQFRAVNQYCSIPGYTGENCEFPICERTNLDITPEPSRPGIGSMTDALMLPNCSSAMTTVLDSEMYEIIIEIEASEQIYPKVVLYNKDGQAIGPMSVTEPQAGRSYVASFPSQPAGIYVIQGSVTGMVVAKCFVIIRAVTTLLTVGGFVPHSTVRSSDRIDYPATHATAGIPSTFIVHADNLRSPGSAVSVTVFENFNVMSRPQQLLTRYNCGYEYFIESFYCRDTTGHYYYRVDGIDFYGHKFSRVGEFNCLVGPPTTARPPTTRDPGPQKCQSGGVLLKRSDGTTYCYCNQYHTGRTCGTTVCANGGTSTGTVCACLPGFSGLYCQDVKCLTSTSYGFNTNMPTLLLVVRLKSSLTDVINQVSNQIQNVYNQLQVTEPGYMKRFILVLFNNDKVIYTLSTNKISDVVGSLQNQTKSAGTAGSCKDSVFSAIELAFRNFLPTTRSTMYVITDAIPSDENKFEAIFHYNTYWNIPIYVLLIEPPAAVGCSLDLYQSGYQKLEDMTKRVSGHIFFLRNGTAGRASMLLYTHMTFLFHRSDLVYAYDAQECRLQPKFQPISVDQSLVELVITATGKNLELRVITPELTDSTLPFTYHINDAYFWSIREPAQGQWMITLVSENNSTACSYRVYSTVSRSDATVAEYDLFWSFSPGLMWDNPFAQPIAGEPNSLVAHLNNYRVTDPSKIFAELIVYKQSATGRETVFASNGIWRDECSYNLFFPAMTCTVPNEILYFTVFVRDQLGSMIQRTGTAFCSTGIPTIEPPAGCLNGGVSVTTPQNATVCYCSPDWTGDKCEIIVCHNGGTENNKGGAWTCDCPPYHTGKFCETVMCTEEGTGEPFLPIERDMIFVVDLTMYGAQALQSLVDSMPLIVRDNSIHHERWIANYTLFGFNSTWAGRIGSARYDEMDLWMDYVYGAMDMLVTAKDQECKSQLYRALDEALDYARQDAYVIVLHASSPAPLSTEAYRAYNAIEAKRVMVNAFYAYKNDDVTGPIPLCGGTLDDYFFLESLAELNEGRTYPVLNSNFYQILPMIPTFYLSGVIYKRGKEDCSVEPSTVYFPIDSYTQTLQLNVFGYGNTITLYKPDGSVVNDTNLFHFIDDMDKTGWRIVEYRIPCDFADEWEAVGNHYCARFKVDRYTWREAKSWCHTTEGGFLMNILSGDQDAWITEHSGLGNTPFWTGLFRAQNGSFFWDSSYYEPVGFNSTRYANWDINEPSPDPTKECVMRTGQGKWQMADCLDKKAFICEKHKYDPTFEPTDLGDDVIPPGKWHVTITTTKPPAGYGWEFPACSVEIRVQSNIQVYPDFVLNQHADTSNGDATSGSDQNRFITYLLGEAGEKPAVLQYANIYNAGDMVMQSAATYEKRYQCTYPWLSQTWSCPNHEDIDNRFAVIHSGLDQTGQTFQRMTTGHCATARTECQNDGIVYNGNCVCMDYWSGKKCEVPTCVNGGVLSKANTCACPVGYTGAACQYEQCMPQMPTTFGNEQKTFVLLVEMTVPNKPALEQLAANIDGFVKNILRKNDWFVNALIVKVNSTNVLNSSMFGLTDAFISAVQQLPSQITDQGTKCGAPLYEGLMTAMKHSGLIKPGSFIFMITRSTPNGISDPTDNEFLLQTSITKPQIYYIAVDDTEKVCGYYPDTTGDHNLLTMTLATGGNFFILPLDQYIQFLQIYLPTLYTSTLLTTPAITETSCKDVQWFAQVDWYMNAFYISTFTTAGALSVIDPQNDVVPIDLLYSNKRTRLYRVETLRMPGLYTVRMNAPTSCYVQVRGDSPVAVWAGYTTVTDKNPAFIDRADPYPTDGVNNVLLLHMEGVQTWKGILTYAELLNPDDGSIVVVSLYKRYNCSYEYYSDQFQCPDRTFLVIVSGMDDNGQNFRREVTFAYCRPAVTAQKMSAIEQINAQENDKSPKKLEITAPVENIGMR